GKNDPTNPVAAEQPVVTSASVPANPSFTSGAEQQLASPTAATGTPTGSAESLSDSSTQPSVNTDTGAPQASPVVATTSAEAPPDRSASDAIAPLSNEGTRQANARAHRAANGGSSAVPKRVAEHPPP